MSETSTKPERLATRYVCSNAGNEAAGFRHTRGNGKPPRKACGHCRGALYVYTGLWGVFTWTGDGRYPEAAALRTFTREALAQAYVDGENTRTDYAANLVLRWIYRPDAS
jgi:hypothetical protein